ncbi:unnamed protein product [Cochlearia groenlandica]
MFLSTKNPPNDPSLSSSISSTNLSNDSLSQSHLSSNFSIRDYAYSNRKKNIKKSWPFSSKSLQLFTTHGVTDPLPPFETKTGKQIVSYAHNGRDLPKLVLNQTIAETRQGVCSQSRIIENGLVVTSTTSVVSKPSSRVEKVVAASTSNNKSNLHSKKCGRRTMVKSKEDSFVTTSESIMVSRTCPICRTFSSASNTTLNAHIDQCLSVDSAQLPPVSTSSKPPNKPRAKPQVKVKTMVDIYTYAKSCTLDDLDRRNGTKWASVLSYTNKAVADKSEVSKKRKVSPVGVGPVYIDAKGQKLRILSGFGEKKTCTTPSREQREDGSSEKKSLSQGSKENSKCSKKRRQGKKHHKYLKLSNHKTGALKQIPEYQRAFSGEGSSTGHRRIYNQRMLEKRVPVLKKLNEKGHKFYALREQPSENEDTWSRRDPDLSATDSDSSPVNKQKLRSEVVEKNNTLFVSKRGQNRPVKVRMSEMEFAGVHLNTVRSKKSLASVQEDQCTRRKNVCSDAREVSYASPRATSMTKLSPPFVANSWRRPSLPVELKKPRLDFSEEEDDEEEEEETGKWVSDMTLERELSDDDYVSGDNGEKEEVLLRSNPSSSGYDDYNDDDEESSEEEDDFNERDNVLDKTNDTRNELYQSDTPPSIEILPNERAMYYSEEGGSMAYGLTGCEEDMRFDSKVGQGSLFVEVDTIPIPGPPGSFLPSPRDMSFDENLDNSSVITSHLHSSIDQLDRNSSESPVSAVSNFAAAGRLSFPADLSSCVRENLSLHIPTPYSTNPMSFSVPYHHGTISEAEAITLDKTRIPYRFVNNDHETCCCHRKERNSEGDTLLQRRVASSSTAMSLPKSPTSLDPNHPFEQSPYMIQQDLISSRMNLNGTVPPSPSNPVLRLMGKDLMVMNQGEAEEDASRSKLATPTPQLLGPPSAGAGLYSNTGLYLRNSFESIHQTQTPKAQEQTQASAFRNNFDPARYFSPM